MARVVIALQTEILTKDNMFTELHKVLVLINGRMVIFIKEVFKMGRNLGKEYGKKIIQIKRITLKVNI